MSHDHDCGAAGHQHDHDGSAALLEQQHFQDVLQSFRDYSAFMGLELRRRELHLAKLPAEYLSRLPASARERPAKLSECVAANQKFLDVIVAAQGDEDAGGLGKLVDEAAMKHGGGAGAPGLHHPGTIRSTAEHHSKVRSVLHSLARDWSEEGAAEREACYGPLLEELARLKPVTESNRNRQRVLIPGCGTGRLLFETCARGYAAEGNEFSFHMLFASNVMLNVAESYEDFTIHPWIDNPNNCRGFEDMARPVAIPDYPGPCALVNPYRDRVTNKVLPPLNPDARMSMAAGDFVSIYSAPHQKGQWDAVLTCFFIDCAPVIHEFVDTIRHCLKPGGVWINLGPLLYHWHLDGALNPAMSRSVMRTAAKGHMPGDDSDDSDDEDGHAGHRDSHLDERFLRSLELPYDDVRHVITSSGFDITAESFSSSATTYAANPRSMLKTVYDCVQFTAVKKAEGDTTAASAGGAAGSKAPS